MTFTEPAPKKKRVAPKTNTRQKWTAEEEEELKTLFKSSLKAKKLPKPNDIVVQMKCSEKTNGVVYKRTKETIKKKLWNLIRKM